MAEKSDENWKINEYTPEQHAICWAVCALKLKYNIDIDKLDCIKPFILKLKSIPIKSDEALFEHAKLFAQAAVNNSNIELENKRKETDDIRPYIYANDVAKLALDIASNSSKISAINVYNAAFSAQYAILHAIYNISDLNVVKKGHRASCSAFVTACNAYKYIFNRIAVTNDIKTALASANTSYDIASHPNYKVGYRPLYHYSDSFYKDIESTDKVLTKEDAFKAYNTICEVLVNALTCLLTK